MLTAFGTAYGTLPERSGDLSKDQHAFLDQAITELAQDGKVVSVRLGPVRRDGQGQALDPGDLA